ncbi:MAG: hypothetical protein V4613_03310 [Bacteroidota bacterium]
MNKQKLQYMAHHISEVSDADIAELKQLIANYPFYALPHAVLAKIYFEREHYMFENALTQAAMRVKDREWLYHYIHTQQEVVVEQTENSLVTDDYESSNDFPEKEIETATTPVTVVEEENEEEATNLEIEAALISDVNAFLGESENAEEIAETEAIISEPEPLIEEIVVNEIIIAEDEIIEAPEVEAQVTTESVIEEEAAEISTITDTNDAEEADDEDIAPIAEHTVVPDINLRKHPVYNVETFLDSEHKEDAKTHETSDRSKDFFYWLSHPAPESTAKTSSENEDAAEEKEENGNDKMNIIDQFIKSNPSITRPKREFYSAENMAKRSELVALDFVSETLANIYYEQGNIDLAVKAYEKLSLQNPLKHAYFASLIEKIKKEKR